MDVSSKTCHRCVGQYSLTVSQPCVAYSCFYSQLLMKTSQLATMAASVSKMETQQSEHSGASAEQLKSVREEVELLRTDLLRAQSDISAAELMASCAIQESDRQGLEKQAAQSAQEAAEGEFVCAVWYLNRMSR